MTELSGPRRLALALEEGIAALETQRAIVPKADQKAINQKLRLQRYMLRWCKSRAGY